MDENPYKSPKEVNSRPTTRQGVAIGTLLLLTIPAGCICGWVTCISVEVAGAPAGRLSLDSMIWLGIFSGLAVAVLVPALAVYFFGKRTDRRS